jgi:hypothetical protein
MAPSRFVFVSLQMYEAYHREWRDIDARYQPLSEPPDGMAISEHWENLASLRWSARQELRNEVTRALAQGFGAGVHPLAI